MSDYFNVNVPPVNQDACGNISWMRIRAGATGNSLSDLKMCGDINLDGHNLLNQGNPPPEPPRSLFPEQFFLNPANTSFVLSPECNEKVSVGGDIGNIDVSFPFLGNDSSKDGRVISIIFSDPVIGGMAYRLVPLDPRVWIIDPFLENRFPGGVYPYLPGTTLTYGPSSKLSLYYNVEIMWSVFVIEPSVGNFLTIYFPLTNVSTSIGRLNALIDVDASAPTDEDYLYWNSLDGKWKSKQLVPPPPPPVPYVYATASVSVLSDGTADNLATPLTADIPYTYINLFDQTGTGLSPFNDVPGLYDIKVTLNGSITYSAPPYNNLFLTLIQNNLPIGGSAVLSNTVFDAFGVAPINLTITALENLDALGLQGVSNLWMRLGDSTFAGVSPYTFNGVIQITVVATGVFYPPP